MIFSNKILFSISLCLGVILLGATGYVVIEHYTFIEGLYMSIITVATVGFGEVKPLSDMGRGFTAFLILVGFVSLAFAGHAMVESLMEQISSGKSEIKKMKKKIAQLRSHYIICGFGRVGMAASEHFVKADVDFAIVENDPKQCDGIRDRGHLFVEGDATYETVLLDAGIKSAKGVLALLASDPDNLFIVLTARELNPTLHIIARAEEESSETKIIKAGADRVISPFATAGRQIADDILSLTGKTISKDDVSCKPEFLPKWISINEHPVMINKTVADVSLQKRQKIIGLRRAEKDSLFPDDGTTLKKDDMILLMDEIRVPQKNRNQGETAPLKLVIIDDNPVILSLYNRLFQKAGFHPLTAENGEEGFSLIVREKPVAAVIDYMLPVLSGIDVCRKLRQEEASQDVKLILFTADDHPDTRSRALTAGADEVVVKSPEASEVVHTVTQILRKK